ncbi:MAG: hypothetical protein IJ525_03735 [Alphaproteobacteria bacterium]|nr:hypothetical protein [Alphaproteobacteria bacterium]
MADNAGDSTRWWQWLANTAGGLYVAKLNSKVTMSANQAALEMAQQQQDETLSFLGYDLHKKTLLWIAGGAIITVLLVAVLKRR